jgi:hypothetical protein
MVPPTGARWETWAQVSTVDEHGVERSVADVAAETTALAAEKPVRLAGRPLTADAAAALFRRLLTTPGTFSAPLTLDAIERKSVLEDAARSGCIAIEVRREGTLARALASGIEVDRSAFQRTVTALRRARGLGIATIARLDLGRPGDDEGVFERTLRFCRRALIAVPIVEAAAASADSATASAATDLLAAGASLPAQASHGDPPPLGAMDRSTLENGVRWTLERLNQHGAIWRRALWPAGARGFALRVGYALRREAPRASGGRYTTTMNLLRSLNRTKRTRQRGKLLATAEPSATPPSQNRSLRIRATANERLAALFIAVEGALDVRGAHALLEQVREALQAGFQRITIDFGGLEWVSADVVTRFVAENRLRLGELSRWIRLENLNGVAHALRRQLGDVEGIRLIESAAAHA